MAIAIGGIVTATTIYIGIVLLEGPVCRLPDSADKFRLHRMASATERFVAQQSRCPLDVEELFQRGYVEGSQRDSRIGIFCIPDHAYWVAMVVYPGADGRLGTRDDDRMMALKLAE